MNDSVPEALISAYFDEQLDEAQFNALRQWILSDDAHARLFLHRAALHRLTREHFVAAEVVAMMGIDDVDSLEELDAGFDGAIDADAVIAAAEEDRLRHQRRIAEAMALQASQSGEPRSWDTLVGRTNIDTTPVRHIVIPRSLVYAVGTALAALLLLTFYLFFGFGSEPVQPMDPTPEPTVASAPTTASIGRVSGAVAAVWADVNTTLRIGDSLPAAPLHLTHGVVELTFDQGAKVLIEAPAIFEPRSADRLVLNAGRLTGHVPSHANGFTVNTPSATVIDLGTAFGITVEENASAATEIHVFEGQVALAPSADEGRATFDRRLLNAGEAGRVDDQGLQPLAFAPGVFLRHLPSNYELLVRRSEPVIYGRAGLDDQQPVVRAGGLVDATLTLEGPLAVLDDLRPDGTRGPVVRFNEGHQGLPIGTLPQWRDQTTNFSLEAWVKPHANLRGNNRIVSSRDSGGGFAWGIAGEDNTVAAPHMSILFSFFTVNDFMSIVPLEPARWSHVVITVDARGYPRFYIDGEEAGTLMRFSETEYRPITAAMPLTRGHSSRQPLVIGTNPPMPPGAPAGHLREDESTYIGDLDHVAIYDHVLDPQTIRMHYLVGSGANLPGVDSRR